MKKIIFFLALLTLTFSTNVYADSISVIVNDNTVDFIDQEPIIIENRVLVPLRDVSEAMGAKISWSEYDETIYITRDYDQIVLKIGDLNIESTYGNLISDVPPQIINNRTMVPLRTVAEAFNSEIKWDNMSKKVIISDGKIRKDITVGKINDSLKNGSEVIASLEGIYPIIVSEKSSIKKVNSSIKNEINKLAKSSFSFVKENASEISKNEMVQKNIFPLTTNVSFNVKKYSEKIVSYTVSISSYIGGAHPSTSVYGFTYNLENGKLVTLKELSYLDTSTINKVIRSAYVDKIKKNPDMFYENVLKILDTEIKNYEFYLTENQIVVFTQEYSVAPYAAGRIEIGIPYSRLGITNE